MQGHYHCVSCDKRLERRRDEPSVPLLVCDDNADCYRETPSKYRRWNGFKYVPDPSGALPCDDECDATTGTLPATASPAISMDRQT